MNIKSLSVFVLIAVMLVIVVLILNPNTDYEKTTIPQKDVSYIREFQLPDGVMPNAILTDKEDNVWISDTKSPLLLRFDPISSKIDSFKIPTDQTPNSEAMTWSMIQTPDESIWLSRTDEKYLWLFDQNSQDFTSFENVQAAPFQLKSDKTGNIWYSTLDRDKLGLIQKFGSNYTISEFNTGKDTHPSGIFLDEQNDSLLVSQIQDNKISKYSIIKNDSGHVINIEKTETIPEIEGKYPASPTDVLVVRDVMWTTEHGTSFITSYDYSSKEWRRYPTAPIQYDATSLPFWMRESLDHKGIWFNEHTGNRVSFLNFTDLTLTEYQLQNKPSEDYVVNLLNIATDSKNPDYLWFSEWNLGKIGLVDKSIPLPYAISTDSSIVNMTSTGKDQNRVIGIIITKNLGFENLGITREHSKIHLATSSSIGISGDLVNMTSSFSQNDIDLNEISGKKIFLQLDNNGVLPGKYVLGISASNGLVTKSIFIDLFIE